MSQIHPRKHSVDAVNRRAVGLVWRIKALEWLADQREVFRIFQRRILRDSERGGCIDEIAISERTPACGMRDNCSGGATGGIDLPSLGSGLHQHRARRGSGLAQRLPEGADRIGIASGLHAEHRIGIQHLVRRRMLNFDFAEIRIEFFGKDNLNRCINALPHLDLRHDQRGLARMINADESIRCEFAVDRVARLFSPLAARAGNRTQV